MKTLAAVSGNVWPSYVEYTFNFRVTAVPGAESAVYRVEAHSPDEIRSETYGLYYRPDFSLEKVTRYDPGGAEETMIQSGVHPFIYYERRLPVIPDFFIAGPADTSGRREFTVAGYRVVQEILLAEDRARITLERLEALGSLRVIMYWVAGDPWWSRIECTENPPPGEPFDGQVVASGHLVKDRAAVPK